MHRQRTEAQPGPPSLSGFPLQPDPGMPPPSAYSTHFPQSLQRPNGTMPTARPSDARKSHPPTALSDVSATTEAVSSLTLDQGHGSPANPPVRRARPVVLNAALDAGSSTTAGSLASDSPAPPAANGTFPLLVKDLDGSTRQVSVPADMKTDEIQKMLLGDAGLVNADGYKLSFGETDIEPGVALSDTNVIPAYTHASSLLQVIGSGRLEPEKTAQALDSVCGVVRSLSNGVTDMDTLCAAATSSVEEAANEAFASDVTREAFAAAEGSSMAWGESPSPAALVRNLSRQLPSLFVPDVSEEFANNNSFIGDFNMGMSGFGESGEIPRFVDSADRAAETASDVPATQPRIADIARIRRAKQASSGSGSGSAADDPLVSTGAFSNLNVPHLDIATTMAAAAASGYGNGQTVVGRSGGTTWMDDLKTTWEAGMMRSSGLLEKTPTGKDLGARLKAVDDEMREDNADMVDADDVEEEDATRKEQGAAPSAAGAAARAHSAMDVDAGPQSLASTKPSQVLPQPAPQPPSAKSSQSVPAGHVQPAAAVPAVPASAPVPAAVPGAAASVSAPPGASAGAASAAAREASPTQPTITRKATLIAPSPPPHMAAFGPQRAAFPVAPKPSVPLRRGRRLKNPQLTPEERAQHRKEQKRASARQSRIRKKSMEDDYQQKVRALLGENNQLKIQVADLSHRLECLQGLLTVSLRPVNQTGGTSGAPLFPVRAPQAPARPAAAPFRLQRPQQQVPQGANQQAPFAIAQQSQAGQQPGFGRQNGNQQSAVAGRQQRIAQQGNPQTSFGAQQQINQQSRQAPFCLRQPQPPAAPNTKNQFRR